jgi:RNA polymerase sigma-70 factor (ECF subfamily)
MIFYSNKTQQQSETHVDSLTMSATVVLEYSTLEEFLKFIEKRAFHISRLSTSSVEDAHDIVQDTMFKLVEKYADKSPADWKPLFYSILRSKITDHYRRKAVRDKIFPWKKAPTDDSEDYFEQRITEGVSASSDDPDSLVIRAEKRQQLTLGIKQLTLRQQQAFMLRAWEGLSTRDTAAAMGCTEGSVKTHYSRAMERLRALLGDYYER